MINIIKKAVISLNVYSLYFVRSFWLKDGTSSEDYKLGSSFTILLITNFAWIYFISNQIPFNWKALLFFINCYHILIALFFSKDILHLAVCPKSIRFTRYYPLFVIYLIIGMILLFFDVLYYR